MWCSRHRYRLAGICNTIALVACLTSLPPFTFVRGQDSDQIDEGYLREPRRQARKLYEKWKNEDDPAEKQTIALDLAEAAVEGGEPEIAIEVATNGEFEARKLEPWEGAQRLLLRECITLPGKINDEVAGRGHRFDWVIRRMTPDRIEVWLPNHGWLFDGQGSLLNEALPPRRDGNGREWYGAFLPDGSWVTTDLWGDDKVLTFFSREGKWLKEINATDLVPHKEGEEIFDYGDTCISTIGWCRCDAEGAGFVVSVGQGSGRGVAWVNVKGEHHLLTDDAAPWKLCFPRDLERKGMYTHLYIPSDDGNEWLNSRTPSHGMLCDSPTITIPGTEFQVLIPEGDKFGFWPNSSMIWIGTRDVTWNHDDESSKENVVENTLFYESGGCFLGWIAGRQMSDTPAHDGMTFCDCEDRVISVGRDLGIQKIEQFAWDDGSVASPLRIFPDLQLGLFFDGDDLVLAKW